MEAQALPAALSVDEAHEAIGKKKISRSGIYAGIKRGEFPSVRLGRRILVPRHAFMRWLESAGRTAQ